MYTGLPLQHSLKVWLMLSVESAPSNNIMYTCFPVHRLENLTIMTDRIHQMRDGLYQALKANGTPGNWEHILKQIGMFSFTGLTRMEIYNSVFVCITYLFETLTKK